jgi:hypothetical protein
VGDFLLLFLFFLLWFGIIYIPLVKLSDF